MARRLAASERRRNHRSRGVGVCGELARALWCLRLREPCSPGHAVQTLQVAPAPAQPASRTPEPLAPTPQSSTASVPIPLPSEFAPSDVRLPRSEMAEGTGERKHSVPSDPLSVCGRGSGGERAQTLRERRDARNSPANMVSPADTTEETDSENSMPSDPLSRPRERVRERADLASGDARVSPADMVSPADAAEETGIEGSVPSDPLSRPRERVREPPASPLGHGLPADAGEETESEN